MNYLEFKEFHAHLYYPLDERPAAEVLINQIKDCFDVPVGRVWDKPVGPHPIGSCQITLNQTNYLDVTNWLNEHRGHFDVFIHAVTGDDYIDHTEYVTWLGNDHQLNLEIFK